MINRCIHRIFDVVSMSNVSDSDILNIKAFAVCNLLLHIILVFNLQNIIFLKKLEIYSIFQTLFAIKFCYSSTRLLSETESILNSC